MTQAERDLHDYVLRLGDDSLVLSHRLAEWTSWAPQIEEDLALANIALDLLGQARLLLTLAGQVEGAGRTEDDLAYLRDDREFRNVLLVEEPTLHDFAAAVGVLLLYAAYAVPLWAALTDSAEPRLAAIAAKAVKEARYHRQHAADWVVRLGDGTAHSHQRMQAAVEVLWPLSGDLLAGDEVTARLVDAGVAADPAALTVAWHEAVSAVLGEATLEVPQREFRPGTGRAGVHSEAFGPMLAEMQSVHRRHPGASW